MGSSNVNIQNDPVLTELFRGYEPREGQFIQDQLLPRIKVGSRKGDIPNVGTNAQSFLKINGDLIHSTSGTPEIYVTLSKSSGWSTERHGLKIPITRADGQQFNNSDWRTGMREAESMFTRLLKKNKMLIREYALASTLFSTGTFSTNNTILAGGDVWSNLATSNPKDNVAVAIEAVFNSIGIPGNVGVCSWLTMNLLKRHPVLKRTNGVGDGTVPVRDLTEAEVASALGLERIIVGSVKYETAVLGVASSLGNVWGDYFLVTYVNPNPDPNIFEKSLGYSFVLEDAVVDTYEAQDPKDVKYVRYDMEYDDVILDESAGYLIVNTL